MGRTLLAEIFLLSLLGRRDATKLRVARSEDLTCVGLYGAREEAGLVQVWELVWSWQLL